MRVILFIGLRLWSGRKLIDYITASPPDGMEAALDPGKFAIESTDVEFAQETVDVARITYGGGVGVVDQDARRGRPGREAAPSGRGGKHSSETLEREKWALEESGGTEREIARGTRAEEKAAGGADVDDEDGMVCEPGVEIVGDDDEEGGGIALGRGGGHS